MKTILTCNSCGEKRVKESLGIFSFAQNAGDTCRAFGCFGEIEASEISDEAAKALEDQDE